MVHLWLATKRRRSQHPTRPRAETAKAGVGVEVLHQVPEVVVQKEALKKRLLPMAKSHKPDVQESFCGALPVGSKLSNSAIKGQPFGPSALRTAMRWKEWKNQLRYEFCFLMVILSFSSVICSGGRWHNVRATRNASSTKSPVLILFDPSDPLEIQRAPVPSKPWHLQLPHQ